MATKYSTQAIVAYDTAKEALLTQKLEDSIRKKREDFIVVHMQHACKYCGEFELSRKLRVEMNDPPSSTKDKDGILQSEIFYTPQAFLGFYVDNHLQFDTLRRAKDSSFVIIDTVHDNFRKSLHCQPLKGQAENNE
ncbi:hypothetical protein AMTR_s03962p00003160, partial [Amborella trichopoda]